VIINQGRLVAMDTPENLVAQVEDSSRLQLLIGGPPAQVEAALSQVEGVVRVQVDSTPHIKTNSFTLDFSSGQIPRKELQAVIAENDWELMEMRSISASLEDVFIKLVTRED
jgi:ABC-2 type transport system ATP-binding protein